MRADLEWEADIGHSVAVCIENGISDNPNTSFDVVCPLGMFKVTVEPIVGQGEEGDG